MIGEYWEIMIDSHLDYVIPLLNLMMIDSIVVKIDCCQINVKLYYLQYFMQLNIYTSTLQIVKQNTEYIFLYIGFKLGDVDFEAYTVTV